MEYAELMRSLEVRFGLEGFAPDADGRYRICIDDNLVVFTELPQSGLIDTVAEVCELPPEGGELVYKLLLTAMAPGGGAEAFTFFISSEDSRVYLRRTDVLARLDGDSFHKALEVFANTLAEWRGVIGDYRQALPSIRDAMERQSAEDRAFAMNADGFLRA